MARNRELTKAENYDFLSQDIPDTNEGRQQMLESISLRNILDGEEAMRPVSRSILTPGGFGDRPYSVQKGASRAGRETQQMERSMLDSDKSPIR